MSNASVMCHKCKVWVSDDDEDHPCFRTKGRMTEREMLIYWLLRAYDSGHRKGWEEGPSVAETMDGLLSVLANLGYDPNLSVKAEELLKRQPVYFVE